MILELENVTKLYKNGRGIKDISFNLASGEVLGLLGPNGSGKTTIMKAIAGLVRVGEGTINVCGVNALSCHEEAMRHVGCLIESPALYEHLSVLTNLKFTARFYSYVTEEDINEILHMVDMQKYANDKVRTLSLGMRQRVGLAMALLSSSQLLVLDEPTNGLDIEGMVLVREIIRTAASNGSAVLVSSHLASEIQHYATQIAVIHEGKLLGLCNTSEILQSFANVEAFFVHLVNETREGFAT